MNRLTLIAAGCTLAVAGMAQGAFVSFASDTNPAGPTFSGFPVGAALGRITDATPVQVNLLVDLDEQGPGGPVSVLTNFVFDATLDSYIFAGGVHIYNTSGSFTFTDAGTNELVLRIQWGGGAFTSLGTGPNALGTSGAVLSNSAASNPFIVTTGGILGGIDPTGGENSFAFTLTNLFSVTGGAVPVLQGGNIGSAFTAEGSFSGRIIPTPGALALLGLGGLAIARRRR